jgi:hypothetical protein
VYLGNCILRDTAVRDVEKVFAPRQTAETEIETAETDPELMLEDFDANDPASVASQFRAFAAYIVKLRSQVLGLQQQQKCEVRCGCAKGVGATRKHTDDGMTHVVTIPAEDGTEGMPTTSIDAGDEQADIVTDQNRNKKKKKRKSQEPAPPTPASLVAQNKDLYIGNVNPECNAKAIKRHIENNGVKISKKEIHQLHDGDDYASFRISVPASKYDEVTRIWSKGIRVRPYTINKGRNKEPTRGGKKNGPFKSNARPAFRTVKPQQNRHASTYDTGHRCAMQDARHHSRGPHMSTVATHPTTDGPCHNPNPWHMGQYSASQFRPNFPVTYHAQDWPPLPRVW